ncbi:MAG TPA: hypothetical protein VNH11_34420, partial [Pirellulales bacterium]|nr:hypothetical protein [Pirellulales bacterium]
MLRAHATRVSHRHALPETNGPQALRPRAAQVPTVALSLEREESRSPRDPCDTRVASARAAGDERAAATLAARSQ